MSPALDSLVAELHRNDALSKKWCIFLAWVKHQEHA